VTLGAKRSAVFERSVSRRIVAAGAERKQEKPTEETNRELDRQTAL